MNKFYLLLGTFLMLSWTASAQLDNITGVTLTFTPSMGSPVVATATDSGSGLAVDGPVNLMESTDYALAVTVQSGMDDITSQISDDADNHQIFFGLMGSIFSGDVTTLDTDSQGLPVGLSNELTTECTEDGNVSGMFQVQLADLTGMKSASSTIGDGTALFDLTWSVTVSDDPDAPPCENEEEIITDVVLTWTPTDGGTPVTAAAQDPDGEGPLDLEVLDPINLEFGTEYTMTVTLSNSIEGEDITEEIMEEDDEHMFFYEFTNDFFANPTGDGNADDRADAVNYNDFDENMLPVGLSTTWTTTGDMGAGSFRIVLKHQPGIKSETSTINDGGTDVDLTFVINNDPVNVDDLQDRLKAQLILAPNPVRDVLNWQLDTQEINDPLEVRIITGTGQVLKSYDAQNTQIDLSQLPAGSYIFQLQSGQAFVSKRFIKM